MRVSECHICSRRFTDWATLSSHMKSHTTKPGRCNECGLDFSDNASLQKHTKVHRLNDDDVSSDSKKSKMPSDIAKDKKAPQKLAGDAQKGDKNCSDINKLADSSKHDTEHLIDNKTDSDCGKTDKVAANGEAKADTTSVKKIKPEEVFKCTVCDKGFQIKAHMLAHSKLHGTDKESNNDKIRVVLKVKANCKDEPKKHACSVCKSKFADISRLRKHLLEKKSVKCFSEMAKNKDVLDKDTLSSCDLCGQYFMHQSAMKRHRDKAHSESKNKAQPESKDKAQPESKDKAQPEIEDRANSESKIVHLGSKQIQCEVCNKNLSYKNNLRRHQCLHCGTADKKPFKCQVCGRGYTTKGNLKAHQKEHHINDVTKKTQENEPSDKQRPAKSPGNHGNSLHFCVYKCHLCSMAFKNRTAFMRHKQWKHSKVHKCKACKRVFIHQSKLEDHLKTHHPDIEQNANKDVSPSNAPSLLSSPMKDKLTSDPLCPPVNMSQRKPLQVVNTNKTKKSGNIKKVSQADIKMETSPLEDNTEMIRLNMCALCGITFSSIQSFSQHSINAHGIRLTGIIDKGSRKSVSNKRRLLIPNKNVIQEPEREESIFSYDCPACKVEVQGSKNLVLHIKKHMEDMV